LPGSGVVHGLVHASDADRAGDLGVAAGDQEPERRQRRADHESRNHAGTEGRIHVLHYTVDGSFESRVWTKALERGLLTTGQVNECLKEFRAESPTLQLTELLLAKGHLTPEQVAAIRGEVAGAGDVPDEVRVAARDPRNLLGRYVLLSELGRGGMGIVYKAWDGDLRRPVALKVLSGPWAPEDLARFRREAQTAAGLRHPNIITVYEIGPSDESPYIALEY